MEQRAWLNGFFAGMLSLDAASSPLTRRAARCRGEGVGGRRRPTTSAPWHDAPCRSTSACSLPRAGRCRASCSRPWRSRTAASAAICARPTRRPSPAATETKLNLCVPGGKETSRMLKRLLEEMPAPAAPTAAGNRQGSAAAEWRRIGRQLARCSGRGRVPLGGAAERAGLGEGHAPCRARHLGHRPRLRAGRQLRPLPQQRSGARRCRARRHARAGGFSRRRQERSARR